MADAVKVCGIPEWLRQGKPRGVIELDGQLLSVTQREAEQICERLAICSIDGRLSELQSQQVAYRLLLRGRGLKECGP